MLNKFYSICFSEIKGRGLFAKENIKSGEVLMTCPIIGFDEDESKIIQQTKLICYAFTYNKESGRKISCLVLGDGSLLNHSDTPNVAWKQIPGETMVFYTIRSVFGGEELCINYGYEPDISNPRIFLVT